MPLAAVAQSGVARAAFPHTAGSVNGSAAEVSTERWFRTGVGTTSELTTGSTRRSDRTFDMDGTES